MITYEFFLEVKLTVIKFSGKIDKKSLMSFLDFLFHKKETTEVSKALLDYRDSILDIPINELGDIVKLRLDNSDAMEKVQTIHLVNSSYETAFTTLFSQQIPKKIADIAVCSTLSRAIELLDINLSLSEMENQLENLKFSYQLPG